MSAVSNVRNAVMATRNRLVRSARAASFVRLHHKYRDFTMASPRVFWNNMRVVDKRRHVEGCVVECGVWRGGMSAGMAEVLGPSREYFLFDSFEGLPAATEADGEAAKEWQQDTGSATYYDNCGAPISFAEEAMRMAGVPSYHLVKGWFDETLRGFTPPSPIAILRVDGDWYESTMVVLESLYRHLAPGGVVILDDYFAWDGCSRAVHDFLSRNQLTTRITIEHDVTLLVPR